ncbi:MAG: hypothetical protein RBQ97_02005 [Acholeplasma sp.]|nr:hypothetical protein [Acholeplasma sp.]
MRKISFVLLLLLTSIFLISCKKESGTNVNIIEQSLEGNNYFFTLNVDGTFTDEEFIELSYSSSSELYSSLKEKINNKKYYLTITLTNNKANRLQLRFVINETIEKPGLQLLSEKTL